MDNRRAAYRVPLDIEVEIVHGSTRQPARVQNLSAGGAMFDCATPVPEGALVCMRLRLQPDWVRATGFDSVDVDLQIIDVIGLGDTDDTAAAVAGYRHRGRSTAAEGSAVHERMTKLVFAAERSRLSARTGSGQASPMASDAARRAARRRDEGNRFGRGSVNPLHDE